MNGSLRRIRRALPFRTPRHDASLFSLFYAGQYAEVQGRFDSQPLGAWSIDDLHCILASLAILHSDTLPVLELIPAPLTRLEFEDLLRHQVLEEQARPQIGLLRQPGTLEKSIFASALGLRAGKTNFVETGTYIGRSVYMISSLFEEVWTVEASPDLFQASRCLFEGKAAKNIRQYLGDSRTFLSHLDPGVLNQAIVFLDAHYSSGITSRAYGRCPVLEEIEIVLRRCDDPLIVVDDIRTMDGRKGYPTIESLLNSLPNTVSAEILFDQMIIRRTQLEGLTTRPVEDPGLRLP